MNSVVSTTYTTALTWLENRPMAGKKRDTFARLTALLAKLGEPQNRLPRVIHVTGTNGKTSVASLTAHYLADQGHRVGLFISPYVVNFRERMQINGEYISEATALTYIQQLQAAATDQTFFELVTAMALLYFADQQLDEVVLEVGIGGTWDSTNIIPTSAVSVITSVDLDHQALLGDTLAKIAEQKAGIIKSTTPFVVLGPAIQPAVYAQLNAIAEQQGATVLNAGEALMSSGDLPIYQRLNIATTMMVLHALGTEHVNQAQLIAYATQLPGRLEQIQQQPAVFLDGAHNPAGIEQLFTSLKQQFEGRKIKVVFAGLAEKHGLSVLQHYQNERQFDIYLTHFSAPHQRAVADDQQQGFRQLADWQQGTMDLVAEMTNGEILVVTGSLYFVSQFRQWWLQREQSTNTR